MPRKKKSDIEKTTTQKGIGDVAWGTTAATNAVTVEGIKAVYQSLTPAEAYTLSIDLQTAIKARAGNLSRCKLRVFDRDGGDEIVSGPLVDLLKRPAPGWSMSAFINEMISWFDLSGEMAASVIQTVGGEVGGVMPLSPFRLRIADPIPANSVADVKLWEYVWPNGTATQYRPSSLIFDKNFNPLSGARGVSPVLAGVNEISAAYQAVAYNKRFFQNDAMPSHILVLPPGISPEDREAFRSEYIAMHSTYNGNAHKVMVVEGGQGLEVKTLEQPVKDMMFKGVIDVSTSKVMSLYQVPPVEGGQWDQTKFDSVDVQREIFVDGPLSMLAERFTQMLQTQLVDPYFSGIKGTKQKAKLSKRLGGAFERARDERPESKMVVVLDLDTLPIVAKLRQSKLDYAQKLQSVLKYTPDQAAEFVGLDPADNEASCMVWVTTTETSVDPDEPDDQQDDQQPEDAPAAQPDDQQQPEEDDGEAAAERADNIKAFFRSLRKLTLDKLDGEKLWTLAEADKLLAEHVGADARMKAEVRRDYHALATAYKTAADIDAKKAAAKSIFNQKNRSYIKSLAS